jgi:sodium pump decarboxylase gamma subunit
MGNGLIDGTLVAVVGVVVVFATLIILMAVILLMGRFFREKGGEPVPVAEGAESIVSAEGEDSSRGEVAAVIALALSLAKSDSGRSMQRKATPRRQPSHWATSGRQQLMNSRGRKRQQW